MLGTVTLCREGSPWREIGFADEGEFRMLAVAPHAQGQGVGEALVAARASTGSARRARSRWCSPRTPEMAAAHRLYERLGFGRCPERDWEPLPGVELLAYRLELA